MTEAGGVPDAVAVIDEPGADDPIVWTENLVKMFGSTAAVRDLNLEIERGTVTGIVGPNGAGKTTTFLMLSTLLLPTSGIISVCGADPVTEARDVRGRLGYMPDFFGIYDRLRVFEYLDFFAAAYEIPQAKRDRLTDDLLELVDLTGKKDAFVDSLSRGMKQRLCLARALVHDPELLILDEPASGLDPRARVELRSLVQELQRMGKTILVSSHILSELEEMCSHMVIMEAGHLVTQGSATEIASGIAFKRRIRVRAVAGEGDRLRAALEGSPGVENVRLDDGGGGFIEVELEGAEAEAAELLARLVRDGIPLVSFSEVSTGLEEIFMHVTKGVVQ